jgi:hypothetical protein
MRGSVGAGRGTLPTGVYPPSCWPSEKIPTYVPRHRRRPILLPSRMTRRRGFGDEHDAGWAQVRCLLSESAPAARTGGDQRPPPDAAASATGPGRGLHHRSDRADDRTGRARRHGQLPVHRHRRRLRNLHPGVAGGVRLDCRRRRHRRFERLDSASVGKLERSVRRDHHVRRESRPDGRRSHGQGGLHRLQRILSAIAVLHPDAGRTAELRADPGVAGRRHRRFRRRCHPAGAATRRGRRARARHHGGMAHRRQSEWFGVRPAGAGQHPHQPCVQRRPVDHRTVGRAT